MNSSWGRSTQVLFCSLWAVVGIQPRTFCILGKHPWVQWVVLFVCLQGVRNKEFWKNMKWQTRIPPPPANTYVHTLMHMHTCTHACKHTHAHALTHTHMIPRRGCEISVPVPGKCSHNPAAWTCSPKHLRRFPHTRQNYVQFAFISSPSLPHCVD